MNIHENWALLWLKFHSCSFHFPYFLTDEASFILIVGFLWEFFFFQNSGSSHWEVYSCWTSFTWIELHLHHLCKVLKHIPPNQASSGPHFGCYKLLRLDRRLCMRPPRWRIFTRMSSMQGGVGFLVWAVYKTRTLHIESLSRQPSEIHVGENSPLPILRK